MQNMTISSPNPAYFTCNLCDENFKAELLYFHIPKCYFEQAQKNGLDTFCTCPEHKGSRFHSCHDMACSSKNNNNNNNNSNNINSNNNIHTSSGIQNSNSNCSSNVNSKNPMIDPNGINYLAYNH
ncbi:hypothetical protein CYY_006593 [Polysphondylium violaceum]|uniref:Uncharacterized protein n=1 Tax=Polysphondylium violaceum TaxID=133409 RepID=A0A8J4PT78_9MYCE|nr:hypothetical protein CYY_006593 [Polysphondylium violaceum]